jgi:Retrotransposon gag protein/Zinc knuckle
MSHKEGHSKEGHSSSHSTKEGHAASKESLVAIIEGLQSQLTAIRHSNGGTDFKAPRPEAFSGEKSNVQAFLTQARAYLYVNHERFKYNSDQVLFVGGLLTGKAAEWWEPTLRDYVTHGDASRDNKTKTLFGSYDAFETALRTTFGNPDEVRTAERQLLALRQTGSAGRYAIEFHRLSSKLDWDDAALIVWFYRGLREDVKDDLSREDRPDTLAQFTALAIRTDNRLYERRQEKGGHGGRHGGVPFFKPRANHGRRVEHRSTAYGHHAGPMELDATRHDKKGGKGCFNCGKQGHYARQCREKRKQPWKPLPDRRANVATRDNGKGALSLLARVPERVLAMAYLGSEEWPHDTQPEIDYLDGSTAQENEDSPADEDSDEVVDEEFEGSDEDEEEEVTTEQDDREPAVGIGIDVYDARVLMALLQNAWADQEHLERPVFGDHPFLHMENAGHHSVSWYSCVYHSCTRHLWNKLEQKWFPRRPPQKCVPRPYWHDELDGWNILSRHPGGMADLYEYGMTPIRRPGEGTRHRARILLEPGQPDGIPQSQGNTRNATPHAGVRRSLVRTETRLENIPEQEETIEERRHHGRSYRSHHRDNRHRTSRNDRHQPSGNERRRR